MNVALPASHFISMMQLDKKNQDGCMRLVLPEGDLGAVIRDNVDRDTISRALQAVGAKA
jgi:3-dehydroquinate synthetase